MGLPVRHGKSDSAVLRAGCGTTACRPWEALGPLLSVAARQESPAGEAVHSAVGLAEERPHATPPRGRLVQRP